MDFMTSSIVVLGFAIVICLCVVKTTWDLSQLSADDSPKPAEPHGSNRTELSDTS